MLHLEYVNNESWRSKIDIQPENKEEIPMLRDMVMRNMLIVNPISTFSQKFKAGEYEYVPKNEITTEADIAEMLSGLWGNEPNMNAMMLLSRAMQMIVDLKHQLPEQLSFTFLLITRLYYSQSKRNKL